MYYVYVFLIVWYDDNDNDGNDSYNDDEIDNNNDGDDNVQWVNYKII